MDTRANYKPTTLHRDPAPLPWRRFLLLVAIVTAASFAVGFAAHALADWMGWVE